MYRLLSKKIKKKSKISIGYKQFKNSRNILKIMAYSKTMLI